jgi:hypothetical protein
MQAEIEILDVTGKRLKVQKVNESNQTIDLSDLTTGVYVYRLTSLDNEPLGTGRLFVNP